MTDIIRKLDILYNKIKHITFINNFNDLHIKLLRKDVCVYSFYREDEITNFSVELVYIFISKLLEINIICTSENIIFYDLEHNCEIKTIKDLLINNTKICKIIITPTQCSSHY